MISFSHISYIQRFYEAFMFDMKNQNLLEWTFYIAIIKTHNLQVISKMIFKITWFPIDFNFKKIYNW